MKFLISNDDGYFSPGIAALAQTLARHGEVVVVAPERDRSGASNSLTLDRPLSVRKAASGFFFVNGTPTDCVHLAVTGLLDFRPDMVVSGINHGANLGDDITYSGTVDAALEGVVLGLPAIAVSQQSGARALDYRFDGGFGFEVADPFAQRLVLLALLDVLARRLITPPIDTAGHGRKNDGFRFFRIAAAEDLRQHTVRPPFP